MTTKKNMTSPLRDDQDETDPEDRRRGPYGERDVWFLEWTEEGWEIRDENHLLVVAVPDPRHERESDAMRLVSGVCLEKRSSARTKRLA